MSEYDPEDEAKLDEWVEAKRSRDFEKADSIRAELREKGINPEQARPSRPQPGDPKVEKMLDDWVEAKRVKDFNTADSIRSDLRKWGIDPDAVRPPGWDKVKHQSSAGRSWQQGSFAGYGPDPYIEGQLDRWVEAKRAKDFRTADDIRDELRKCGIEPDIERPSGGKSAMGMSSGIGVPTGWGPVHMPMHMPVAFVPMQVGGKGGCGRGLYGPAGNDQWVEQKLDRWVEAKRNKDFKAADGIRDELRRMGIEPDSQRPALHKLSSDDVERELDNWVEAKRNRNFKTADTIRDRLRKLGVEPDVERPPGDYNKKELHADEIDVQLDKWVEAKRARDFKQADSIRKRLREVGVDPDDARPPRERKLSRSEIERKLDEWVEAKRSKDFELADSIRDELRQDGIEPDRERPAQGSRPLHSEWGPQSRAQPAHADVDRMLDDWVDAKRGKDFARADSIRNRLRDLGVDPDHARPRGGAGGCAGGWATAGFAGGWVAAPSQADIDYQLDCWVEAKRARDFATADAIREQLRALNVDPDRERPPGHAQGPTDVERMLDDWVNAKRAKDFQSADDIRKRLRALGVEPDEARPAGGSAPKRARLY